ncbi:acetyl esterase/lipase [Pseudomonas corrugata]|uniref:alpha/beta hydrolase n=1 Tax=Pseudomonas corrugata TaxID=47879 RepID=UPI00285F77AD|nr:alpha/beta hydrolase [Pseudomonas corrugata]MDR7283548.1 acetyl esterase/lipase [Pseudomonas corrugata]
MSSCELNAIRDELRSRRENPPESLQRARIGFDQLCNRFSAPPNCISTASTLGGVPVRTVTCVESRRSLLYVHGGGFMVGSAEGFEGIAGTLAAGTSSTAYVVDYRLTPENAYPAAQQDVLTAYAALLANSESANDIALVGDSAGAQLIMAALIHARTMGMEMPGCVVLFSPWVDLALTGESILTKATVDFFLTPQKLQACADAYLGEHVDAASFILEADLECLPPLMIQVGECEILLDDAVRLARIAGSAGVDTRLEVWPGMFHVWQAYAPALSEGREALAAAVNFINRVLERKKAVAVGG